MAEIYTNWVPAHVQQKSTIDTHTHMQVLSGTLNLYLGNRDVPTVITSTIYVLQTH